MDFDSFSERNKSSSSAASIQVYRCLPNKYLYHHSGHIKIQYQTDSNDNFVASIVYLGFHNQGSTDFVVTDELLWNPSCLAFTFLSEKKSNWVDPSGHNAFSQLFGLKRIVFQCGFV